MRWVRAVCVLGLAACGYPPLALRDAGPDATGAATDATPDAPPDAAPDLSHVVLTWQLATTSASGAPSPLLEYPPFAPGAAPQVRIATLDGSFTPATYSSDPITPGWIPIPRSYVEPAGDASAIRPWRLEYTLPGGVPHEVQWAPDATLGHLVVPMVGRLDRQPAPLGSGYRVTLSNFTFPTTGPVHRPGVLTTGLWTAGSTVAPSGAVVDYDFANAVSLSGARGSPVVAQGDRAFLVDFVTNPDGNGIQCNVAVGATALTDLTLSATGHTAQTAVWDQLRQPVTSELPDLGMLQRLTSGLGPLNTTISSQESQLVFGVIPSTSFPGLIGASNDFRLPIPVMQALLLCPQGPQSQGPMISSAIPATAQPMMLGDFPTAVHVQLVEVRTISTLGVTLYSGMETVIAASAGGGFKMSFPAAIPTGITITTPAAGKIDLASSADRVAVGAASGRFTLDFVPETGVGLRADYYDVYLHRIGGGKLTPVRIYTVTAPEVVIDGSVLTAGADHVFEIRSYAGHPMAPRGDFAPVAYPYGSAVVFTRTFKAS